MADVDSRGRRGEMQKQTGQKGGSAPPRASNCNEAQCIMATKALFEKPVETLREGLNGIDECSEHGHYTRPLNADHKMPYHELMGHPLPCTTVNADCESSLRVLCAGATHFPLLRRLVGLPYEAIR